MESKAKFNCEDLFESHDFDKMLSTWQNIPVSGKID